MKTGLTGNVHAAYNQVQNISKHQYPNNVDKQGLNDQISNLEKHMQLPVDVYIPSAKGAADPATIQRLWNETNHAAEAIRKLVQSMLGRNDASGQGFWAIRAKGKLTLSEADRAQAQAMIGEDGFFGVAQTSARIMDFAKALVGENASEDQIIKMRNAVQKGFDEVARMFGGFDKLPDVTKQTYDTIMKAFDEWLSGGKAEDVA